MGELFIVQNLDCGVRAAKGRLGDLGTIPYGCSQHPVISTEAWRNGEISLLLAGRLHVSAKNAEIPRLHFVPLGMTC